MTTSRNLIEALQAAPGERPFITYWTNDAQQETVTFAQFRQLARFQAGTLRENGVGIGDRVVIIMPQGIPAMAAFAGAILLGAVPAFVAYPNFKIDAAKYRSGLAGVTANLGARAMIIDRAFPDKLLDHVSLDTGAALVRAQSKKEGDAEAELPQLEIAPDSIAFIQHSAGTTGLQKGVALTHAAVLRQIELLSESIKIDAASDRIYSWLPLYHDMGLIACFMLPMIRHLHLVIQSPLDWVMQPESMLQIVSECRCSLAWLPNFAFQFVPRRTPQSRWARYDLSPLRALINCSEPVRTVSMREFETAFAPFGLKSGALQSSYAMAENVFAVTQSRLGADSGPASVCADGSQFRAAHRVVPVAEGTAGAITFSSSGRLLPNHEVRIASDAGDLLADGHVGEIQVKSDCLFQGYYNRPDLTAEAMVDGWYCTGDLGFRWGGELYVVGRKKDLLIVGGENLYPQDIEEIVCAHPAIHDGRGIALGLYNADLGTEDIVVVAEVERDESLANAAAIERELRSQVVAGLGVAVRTIFLKPPKWIVKSTAGKAARAATRDKLLNEHPELNRQS
jgi:acyl-CoA synthetase (AMP-forming)/AMP-acid ligase II